MEAFQLIEKYGVTLVVLLWFMLRSEKRMDRMAELLASLIAANEALAKAIDRVQVEGDTPRPRRLTTKGGPL